MSDIDDEKFKNLSKEEIDLIIPSACDLKNKFMTLYNSYQKYFNLLAANDPVPLQLHLQNVTNRLLATVNSTSSENVRRDNTSINDKVDENHSVDVTDLKKNYGLDDVVLKRLIIKDYEQFYTHSKYI